MCWCCWFADATDALMLWYCCFADAADALILLMLLRLLMRWCCWYADAADALMLWCTDAADVLILLMRWCCWCADVVLMISVFIVITVTKVIVAFMFKLLSRTGVCSKSGLPALRIVIGRYGYKSSFGANNKKRWETTRNGEKRWKSAYLIIVIFGTPPYFLGL